MPHARKGRVNRAALARVGLVARRTSATALESAPVIAPDRVTQVQRARVRGSADSAAGNRAGYRAESGVTADSTKGRATRAANQGATGQTIARIGATTRKQQGRGKSSDQQFGSHGMCSFYRSDNAPSHLLVPNPDSVSKIHQEKRGLPPSPNPGVALRHSGKKMAIDGSGNHLSLFASVTVLRKS